MTWSPGPSITFIRQKIASSAPAKVEHVVGLDRLVGRGDLAAEQRVAGRLGVAELEALPERAGLGVGEGDELGHREALDVRCAEQVLDLELPFGEVALEGEVGDAHVPMMRHHAGHGFAHRDRSVCRRRWAAICPGWRGRRRGCAPWGSSTACASGRASPGCGSTTRATCPSSPGSSPIPTRGPRTGRRSARSCRASATSSRRRWHSGAAGADARLLVLGGDCTAHAGALAGLRAARPGARYAIAWFDAHGDFNTPDTTPSGNVWGMPFAMLLGRGDPDLVAAADGPTVMEQDAALFGGQVLDETESRMLAASRVAQFGAGMLGTEAGRAAVEGWARAVAIARRRDLHRLRHGLPRRRRRAGR